MSFISLYFSSRLAVTWEIHVPIFHAVWGVDSEAVQLRRLAKKCAMVVNYLPSGNVNIAIENGDL